MDMNNVEEKVCEETEAEEKSPIFNILMPMTSKKSQHDQLSMTDFENLVEGVKVHVLVVIAPFLFGPRHKVETGRLKICEGVTASKNLAGSSYDLGLQ